MVLQTALYPNQINNATVSAVCYKLCICAEQVDVKVNTIKNMYGASFNTNRCKLKISRIGNVVYKKVKFALEQTVKAQSGSRIIIYTCFNLGARWGRVVNARSGRFAPGKTIRYQSYTRLGGPQDLSRRVRKISPTNGI